MATEIRTTVCNRDCPDACGLVVTVEDGKVTRIGGDPDHPVTQGFICHRTSQFPALQNAPDRVTAPLRRTPSGFAPTTWDDALSEIAGLLLAIRAESGPAAILHYRSGGSLGVLKSVTDLFWEAFGPVTAKSGDISSASDLFGTVEFLYFLLLGFLAAFGAGPLSLDGILVRRFAPADSPDAPARLR